MSNLSKLTLTTTTPNQPLTPLARKRIKLLRKLDQQLLAAECASEGMEQVEDVKRWVKNEQTGEKELVTQSRPVKNGGGRMSMAHLCSPSKMETRSFH